MKKRFGWKQSSNSVERILFVVAPWKGHNFYIDIGFDQILDSFERVFDINSDYK